MYVYQYVCIFSVETHGTHILESPVKNTVGEGGEVPIA